MASNPIDREFRWIARLLPETSVLSPGIFELVNPAILLPIVLEVGSGRTGRRDMSIEFKVNGRAVRFDGAEDTPLLWYLRDHAGLTGTKYGCGIAACGACSVHVDGRATRSCTLPVSALAGREVTTIEGLADGDTLHPVQQAWIAEDVPQCGYCQAGQLMAAADLLRRVPDPTDADIATLTNLCRCGTYPRIRKAIKRAAALLNNSGGRA